MADDPTGRSPPAAAPKAPRAGHPVRPELSGPQAQERDRIRGGEERVGHHPPVVEREGGCGFPGNERKEHVSLELGGVVEFREPADEVVLVSDSGPQLNRGRMSIATEEGKVGCCLGHVDMMRVRAAEHIGQKERTLAPGPLPGRRCASERTGR